MIVSSVQAQPANYLVPINNSIDRSETAKDDSAKGESNQNSTEVQNSGKQPAKSEQQLRTEQAQITQLAARDREIRAHEQAHAALGGTSTGSPSYTYERGPNGVNYAVAGEVPIRLPSLGDNPQQTLAAAQQVKRAALAPANPSSQDRNIAAQAALIEAQARLEIVEQQTELQAEADSPSPENSDDKGVDTDAQNRLKAKYTQQASTSGRFLDLVI